MNSISKLTPIALLVIASTSQAAQTMDTMVVTASSGSAAISDTAATMWVIDQEQLERETNAGADLKTALGRLIPGFDFGGEGRTNYAQNLRGRTAQVMIDGVSLNSTRSISRQLESIDPFNVSHVEVLSGATSIYGAGASGGIINIITKKAQQETQVELKLGGASGFNSSDDLSKEAAIAISGGNDKLRGRFSAALEQTGAKYDANGDMILPDITQTDLQFNDTIDVMGNVEYQINPQQLFSITAQYYNSEQDSDYGTYLGPSLAGIFGYPEYISVQEGLQLDEQPATERIMVNAQYSHQDFLSHRLIVQAYYRSESMQFFPFPSLDSTTGTFLYGASVQETEILGAKVLLSKQFNDLQVSYGMDAELESFSADQRIYDTTTALASGGLTFIETQSLQRYPDIDTQKVSAFAQADWQVNSDWNVSGGLRYQYIGHEVGDQIGLVQQYLYGDAADTIEGGSTHYGELLANLGAIYNISDQQQVWGNFSQGFELPDPAKYYGNGTYSGSTLVDSINVADSELEGVKTNSVELGWRLGATAYDLQVAAYYSLSDKTTSYDSDTLAIVVNDDQKRIYGIEGQFNYQFTNNWYSGIQAHLIKSETKSDGSWSNLAAEEASPSNSVIRGGYDNTQYGAELQLQTLFDYSDDQGGELNGYSLANLSGYYTLPLGKVSFGIQNLLDKDYETIWSQRAQILYSSLSASELFTYNGQGRTYALTYDVKF